MTTQKKSAKFFIPRSWSLFEAIESFTKSANMGRKLRIDIPLGLSYVDFFFEGAMKKSITAIQLPNGPIVYQG